MSTEERIRHALTVRAEHPTVCAVVYYPEGFVANAYTWPCPRTRIVIELDGGPPWTIREEQYDAKRARGHGPAWVGVSAKRGRVVSG